MSIDFSKKIISLIALMNLISLVTSDKCKAFTCGTLAEKICYELNGDNVTLNTCPKGFHCPINSEGDKKTCQPDVPIVAKLYPGSTCTVNEDCFSEKCESGKCVGVGAGNVCVHHDDCDIGQACYLKEDKKICQPYRAENEICDNSYECPRTHGCLNGICKAYFSAKLLDNVVEEKDLPHLSFCASGKSIKGVCRTLKQSSKTCTDTNTCEYQLDDGTKQVIDGTCACGFNKDSQKYCMQDTDSKIFKESVDRTKIFLTLPSCHTLERNEQCNFYKRFPDEKKDYIKYHNSYLLNDKSNVLANYDKCVLAVVYPNYDSSVDPIPVDTYPKCAKYFCEKNDKNVCALGHYDDKVKFSHVSLNDICEKNQFCDVPTHQPFIEFTKTTDKDVQGTCTDKKKSPILAYPGEPCTADTDCFKDPSFPKVGKCESKVCSGAKAGEACSLHTHCTVGNYCDNKTNCKAQKSENEVCGESWECSNALACFEGKCLKKYFSLSAGNKTNDAYLCDTLTLNPTGDMCYSLNSTDTKIAKESNLVRCEFGSKCNYTDNTGAFVSLDCECGYNSDGVGYCPRDDVESNIY
jgi:hypothetical protein